MTQQQQRQTTTDGKTAVATRAREDPSGEEEIRDCGPVSPGEWLEICDIQPPIEEDDLQAHYLFFEKPLGCVTMRIITWAQYLEHVTVGDWLRVGRVTFNRKGVPLIFQLETRFKDTDLHFDVRFVEAQILEPAEPECLSHGEETGTLTFQ